MVLKELVQLQVISILQFAIVLAIGVMIVKLITDALTHFLKKPHIKKLISRLGYEQPVIELITMSVKYLLYFVTVIIALSQLGFGKFIFDIIIVLLAFFIIALMLFSIKDFIPNASAGIFLSTFKSVKKGDKLKVGEYQGKVIDFNLVNITLEDKQGRLIVIPNSVLINKEIMRETGKKK